MADLIRQFRTKNFTVRVVAEEDLFPGLTAEDDETGEQQRRLDNGELVAFTATAKLYMKGFKIAEDHLGSCIYESPKAFMDHKGIRRYSQQKYGNPKACGSYFSDMVRSVIAEGRKAVKELQVIRVR